jgi:hypothetical protein
VFLLIAVWWLSSWAYARSHCSSRLFTLAGSRPASAKAARSAGEKAEPLFQRGEWRSESPRRATRKICWALDLDMAGGGDDEGEDAARTAWVKYTWTSTRKR